MIEHVSATQRTSYTGTPFTDHRVTVSGDRFRVYTPDDTPRGVLWLFHAAGSSEKAIDGGYARIAQAATDAGIVAVCPNLGGTRWTEPAQQARVVEFAEWAAAEYGTDRAVLMGTSHGGAMSSLVYGRRLIPGIRGLYVVNGVYDLQCKLYESILGRWKTGIHGVMTDREITANNPAKLPLSAWVGTHVRLIYNEPIKDGIDPVPPAQHAIPFERRLLSQGADVTSRTHRAGHKTPSFVKPDALDHFTRWLA